MPKMTKAQARKRLGEAIRKIIVVWNSRRDELTRNDFDKLMKALNILEDIEKKLK
tara:strand:- start:1149 stop:1313 length:165 start_codon:yes stop_codon:yes gene_type:complete